MIVKLSHTAPFVKQLVQSALSLPTTLSSPASPSASWKVTLCRLYLVCECVDVATSDSSMLAPDCPD